MSTPELSVVCKSCGEEVSPYVTECPYCGSRIRKRAPKLERRGDELAARESRRRRLRPKMPGLPSVSVKADRPYATTLLIVAPAVLLLVIRATGRPLVDFGAMIGPVGTAWWRYIASPFVYDDLGYLFAVAVAVALFGSALERRLGTMATGLLAIGCGGLGMLAADGIETAISGQGHIIVAVGGNGIALGLFGAWALIKLAEVRAYEGQGVDVIPPAIAAAVLFFLPLIESGANVFAGLGGGAVGAMAGLVAGVAIGRHQQP